LARYSESEITLRLEHKAFGRRSQDSSSIHYIKKSLYAIITGVIFLMSFIAPSIGIAIINIPYLSIAKFQIWRLFICLFGTLNVVGFLINILMVFFISNSKEREIGTIPLMIDLFSKHILIQILFSIFGLLLYLIFSIKKMGIFGIFPSIFFTISEGCLSSPNSYSSYFRSSNP